MSSYKYDPADKSPALSRRLAIHGGLAGLAAALVQTHLSGCSSEDPNLRFSEIGTQEPYDQGVSNNIDQMTTEPTDQSPFNEMEDMLTLNDMSELPDAGDLGEEMLSDMSVINEIDMSTADAVAADFPRRILPEQPLLVSDISSIGSLLPADENGLRLPEGFSSRIVARSRETVGNTDYLWHAAPDGGATYPTEDGGWIYVSNSEITILGGVSAIRFNTQGDITDAYNILTRTNKNCAGGITPWHTWLSCEEVEAGQVYECSPWGDQEAILRPALGTFKHEAVAVDSVHGHLYLTEDEPDGAFYRFTADQFNADGHPHLASGILEVASVSDEGLVTWLPVPDPQYTGEQATRYQVPESTSFSGGEGIWYFDSVIYFSTKGDNRVWAYHTETDLLEVLYDGNGNLSGVDNLTVSCCGDVLVAEDGGNMQIVAIAPNGELKTLVQVEGQDDSEITGPAFDPSGTRLYFSSQRGQSGLSAEGITYEIRGPFHRLAT